ncbi:MAG: terminase small subunit [Candidatus Competibacter sp.]
MSEDSRPVVTTLKPKQVRFLEHYLTCWNATEAARVARYAHPNKQGPELLKNEQIAAAVSERLEDAAMSANEVLARLSAQARADMADFIRIVEGDEHGQETTFRLDMSKAAEAGHLHLLRRLTETTRTVTTKEGDEIVTRRATIELHNAQTALELLARHHRLLTDQVDVTTKGQAIKGYANVSPDDWDDAAASQDS